MIKNQFEIKILNLSWLEGLDESHDLCAHGSIYVKIGDEIISNKEEGEWTSSSTALYLMRTTEKDYKSGDFAGQLLPCCGHFFMADEEGESVAIMGCPSGIDWTIRHIENNQIKHITKKGTEGVIDKKSYRKLVLEFANVVEAFYQESKPKKMPEDEFDKKGYLAFWREWKTLKEEIEK